ncbi:hypothetical protein BDP27DRAFT_1445785 [Rhodocollybia butyracea]|uniref:Uncharacterized protein n=1 Tax=Rhodocollybia butyracea TaxID=206335 RepID=A0A9P5Q2C0_9AGAR|nr:hypothetical protein BDP27DRAFT_1445785 [Rhodocollybia butyracea]
MLDVMKTLSATVSSIQKFQHVSESEQASTSTSYSFSPLFSPPLIAPTSSALEFSPNTFSEPDPPVPYRLRSAAFPVSNIDPRLRSPSESVESLETTRAHAAERPESFEPDPSLSIMNSTPPSFAPPSECSHSHIEAIHSPNLSLSEHHGSFYGARDQEYRNSDKSSNSHSKCSIDFFCGNPSHGVPSVSGIRTYNGTR